MEGDRNVELEVVDNKEGVARSDIICFGFLNTCFGTKASAIDPDPVPKR